MFIDRLAGFSTESGVTLPVLYSSSAVGLIEPLLPLQRKVFQDYEDLDGNRYFRDENGHYFGLVTTESEARYLPLKALKAQNLQMVKTSILKMKDKETGEIVAAKTEFIQPLLNEAAIMADVAHPNVAAFYDLAVTNKTNGTPYIIMEWMAGGTLEDRLHTYGHPIESAASIIDQVAAAMSHINKKGYIYGDIKPGNIMFNDEGQVKLIDFDNSFPVVEDGGTASDIFCFATHNYASPEQLILTQTSRGKLYFQSDVYSLAAVLFEMLTPEIGMLALFDREIFVKNHDKPLPLMLGFQAIISTVRQKELARILRKALSTDYYERQSSIEEFNNEVQEVLK